MARLRFAQNDLARLSYSVQGEGKAVFLLPPTLSTRSSMNSLIDAFPANRKVIVPDARGHGGSTAITGRQLSIADLANDVWAVMEAESPDQPVDIVGAGQGAVVGIELARRRPDRVDRVIAIEPDAFGLPLDHPSEVVEIAREQDSESADAAYKQLGDRALNGFLDRRLADDWAMTTPKPQLAAYRRHVAALAATISAMQSWVILPEDLAEMSSVLHVVVGSNAPAAEQEIGSWLARQAGIEVETVTADRGKTLASAELVERVVGLLVDS